jgi:trehalose 6-phosphate phosphatase
VDAKRLAGVGAIAYAGGHGAELLWPGDTQPSVVPEFERYAGKVHEFAAAHDGEDLRGLGIRLEDKGPIVAFHWRGAPDEDAAHARLSEIAAQTDGLAAHWGRKVLEIRPPVPMSKARAVEQLIGLPEIRTALYGGDDTTDLDAFDALDAAVADGRLDAAVRVGVVSSEGPREIEERADLAVQGTGGFLEVLHHL